MKVPRHFDTTFPVTGTIACTPAACSDEIDRGYDFTFMPTGAPEQAHRFAFCCRMG